MHLVFICFWNINKTYKHKLISQKSAWLYMCHIFLSLLLWINGSKQSKSELISNVCMKYDIVFPYLKRISSIVPYARYPFYLNNSNLRTEYQSAWPVVFLYWDAIAGPYFCIGLLTIFDRFGCDQFLEYFKQSLSSKCECTFESWPWVKILCHSIWRWNTKEIGNKTS